MDRKELLDKLRAEYIPSRVQQVEREFIEFEEEMARVEDLERILNTTGTLSNDHNSALLYICGRSNTYDFNSTVDTIGGTLPDIDLDFETLNYQNIVDWITEHYGREHVANILALQKFKPKSTVRKFFMVTEPKAKDFPNQVAYERALKEHKALQYEILDKIPKAQYGFEASLDEVINGEPDKGYEPHPELRANPKYKPWLDIAEKLEGMVSTFSIHAAGLLVLDDPVYKHIPCWYKVDKESGGIPRWITQFSKDEIEELGGIKFDLLRIDNLSVIKQCIQLIKERHEVELDLYNFQDGDYKTYEIMGQGYLAGVFQMEAGKTALSLCQGIKPTSIDELSDLSALNRPGPIKAGLVGQYISNKNSGTPPPELHPKIAPLLDKTYWTLVYQEQVMSIVSEIAGFSLKEADAIRRGMGKKKEEYLTPYKQAFIDGCVKRGIDTAYATTFWEDVLVGFSKYAFNKSHSACYSYLTYVCAWLKAHYPIEFFTALMSVRSLVLQPKTWNIKAPSYVSEAKHFNIEVRFPDVNRSMSGFTIHEDTIYFGFGAIKRVGATTAQSIIDARGDAPFKGIIDFLKRVDKSKVNTGIFQQLAIAGCFDNLGYKRQDLLDAAESLYDHFKAKKEYEERELENALRIHQNIEIQEKINYRDELRKKAKKEELTEEEQQFLLDNKRLALKKPLKLPEIQDSFKFERYKKVPISIDDLLKQGDTLGCFILHPARLAFPQSTPIGALTYVSDYTIAGIVKEIKSYGDKHYVITTDGTGEINLIFNNKTRAERPKIGQLIEAQIRGGIPNYSEDDDEDEIANPKCFSVKGVRVYGEN